MDVHKVIQSEKGLALLDRVRGYCLSLPEATERVDSFGHTTFRVNDKPFVMMGERDHLPSLAIKTALTTQEFFLQQEDSPFFKTAYIGQHGWVSVTAIDRVPWKELEDLMLEGYARSAPKRLLKLLHP